MHWSVIDNIKIITVDEQHLQAAYPDVVDAITKNLDQLQEAAAPITLVTVRGVVVATILKMVLHFAAQTRTYVDGCMVLCCGRREGLQEQHISYPTTRSSCARMHSSVLLKE